MTWSLSISGGGQGNQGSAYCYFGKPSGPGKSVTYSGPVHEIAGKGAAFIEACLQEEQAEAEKEAAEQAEADKEKAADA